MKILLTTLNAKYVHSCLALKYLCTAALNAGFDAEYREFTINNDMHYVYGELVRGDYDLIGFSCYIWNIEKIKELAADIKKACPRVRILLGGPEAGSDAVSFLAEHRGRTGSCEERERFPWSGFFSAWNPQETFLG